jgi:hypothetical protein
MTPYRENGSYRYYKEEPIIHGEKELLLMQSKGKRLTLAEKQRVLEYERETRNKRKK